MILQVINYKKGGLCRYRYIYYVTLIIILTHLITACKEEVAEVNPEDEILGKYANYEPPSSAQEPGGETTNKHAKGGDAFSPMVRNISSLLNNNRFQAGNALFREVWVISPSSTDKRDGLGPFYNETSCASCHFKDGRGRVPKPGVNTLKLNSMLIRLSVPAGNGFSKPHSIYGEQLQPFGVPGVKGEASQGIKWESIEGSYPDGEKYKLYKPIVDLFGFNYGDPGPVLYTSARIAPQLIGSGLLEAITEEDIRKNADPDDKNGDGISGRMVIIPKHPDGDNLPGRFGWKAEQPTVNGQNAAAFFGDMGITSPFHRTQNCPNTKLGKEICVKHNHHTPEHPEIEGDQFGDTGAYVSLLAVPERRSFGNQQTLRGERLFLAIGCANCHRPTYITGKGSKIGEGSPFEELRGQEIWPYTDLLVHDMGEGLSDGRPAFNKEGAGPREWRTPPLWGIGLIPAVNGHQQLLHDGRATGVAEAILWHGGEASAVREKFKKLDKKDREALIIFVNSL